VRLGAAGAKARLELPLYHDLRLRVVEDAEAEKKNAEGSRALVFVCAVLLGLLALWIAPDPEKRQAAAPEP